MGHGFVGARGYMDELVLTNVTSMKISITAAGQVHDGADLAQRTRHHGQLRLQVPGRTELGAPLPHPAGSGLAGPTTSPNDDANNFIYRMKLKFVWSNPSSSVTRTIARHVLQQLTDRSRARRPVPLKRE